MENNQAQQGESPPKPQTILLHVLSPSLDEKLIFSESPTSLTVIELKRIIQHAVATKPMPERQRLIYRGKALTRDEVTLAEVFGQDAISSSEALSLHLVLPATPSTSTPPNRIPMPTPREGQQTQTRLPSPGSFNLQHQALPREALPPRPHSTPGVQTSSGISAPVYNSMPYGGESQPQGPPLNPHFPQGPMHPPMQDLINNHFMALNQQMRQMGHASGHTGATGPPASFSTPQAPLLPGMGQFQPAPPMHPAQFQQILAQQQHARAAAARISLAASNRSHAPSSTPEAPPHQSQGQQVEPPSQPNSQEFQNPIFNNGQAINPGQWRVVINHQTTTHLPMGTPPGHGLPIPGNPNFILPGNTFVGNPQEFRGLPPLPNPMQRQAPHSYASNGNPLSLYSSNPLVLVVQRLAMLESMLSSGGAPSELELDQASAQLTEMLVQNRAHYSSITAPLFRRLADISMQALLARQRNAISSEQAATNSGQAAASNGQAAANTTAPALDTNSSLSTSPTVYLLSSPSGPHALLVSPSSTYSSPNFVSSFIHGNVGTNLPNLNPRPPNGEQAAGAHGMNIEQAMRHNAQRAEGERQPDEAQQGQLGDLLRVLLPLGGNLWLLIRFLGVVYMFTGGWRRTIILGIGAVIAFLAQTGLFRPLQQAFWVPIQRHVEELLHPGGNDVVIAPAVDAVGPDGQALAATPQLNPEQMVARLLRERREREQGPLRRNIRRVERALAFFVASLIPGVGEHHIAARNAIETARLEQERVREEQLQRQETEAAGAGVHEDGGAGAVEQQQSRQAEQPPQQPLIEI